MVHSLIQTKIPDGPNFHTVDTATGEISPGIKHTVGIFSSRYRHQLFLAENRCPPTIVAGRVVRGQITAVSTPIGCGWQCCEAAHVDETGLGCQLLHVPGAPDETGPFFCLAEPVDCHSLARSCLAKRELFAGETPPRVAYISQQALYAGKCVYHIGADHRLRVTPLEEFLDLVAWLLTRVGSDSTTFDGAAERIRKSGQPVLYPAAS